MSKKFLVRKSAAILGLIGALSMSLFNSCTKDNPTALDQDKPSYDFSGFVIDGYTGKALGGAVVTYYDEDNDSVTFTTRTDGGFDIKDIPYGDKSFFFSYKPTGATAVQYTTAAITIEGNDWVNFAAEGIGAGAIDTAFGAIRNVAGPVKLYPLSGSLTGSVFSQIHSRGELNPVGNTVVKVTFDPASNLDNQGNDDAVIGSNVEIGPRTFEALTDVSGRFTITGLPVSGDQNEKVKIKVISVTSNGIDWAMTGDGINVELVSGQSVPVGQIIMNPLVKIALIDLDNNFKTGVVSPEHTFEITYSDSLDSVVTYAVLSYDDNMDVKRNVPVTIAVSGKKVSINPSYSLINEQNYSLDVFAYGRKGQSFTKSFVITAAGGGLSDVVTSNILTNTKAPVYNFNVKEPITITFADSIVGKPSVQVTNNDVTASASGKILTITPKSIWKNGAVGVNVVLNNGTTVRFSTPLNVENALSFVTSNIYDFNSSTAKNGLGLTDPIVFTTNKAINNAAVKVILTQGGVSLPTTYTVPEGDQQIDIRPVNTLKAATSYVLTITVESANGESKSQQVTFTTTAAKFYPLADNVRIGNDANMPRLDFAPNANIVIKMNKKVVNATASLTYLSGGIPTGVNTKVATQNDSVVIDPEDILTEGTAYSLSLTAEDSLGNTISGAYVTGLVPRALVMIVWSNIITSDNQPIVNADRAITPCFKLSTAPEAATIKVIITNPSVDADVTVRGDTLFVNPVADFKYGANPTVTVTGVATNNNYISFVKSFTVEKKPAISIVASNVLNDNYEGLTNVAENIEMWYLLSRTPVAAKIAATVDGNNAVIRVKDDTVFVKPVKVFSSNATPVVRITGLDDEGLSFDLLGSNAAVGPKTPDWPSFTVRPALFPVASNTWDANGDPVKNFAFYDTMWVKFSQALSIDLSLITWSAPAVDVVVNADPTGNPNSTAWVKGDTLFVLPDNRVAITYGKSVGFGVVVKTALGQASGVANFKVETAPLNLFVKATNTLDGNGERRENFGLRDTVFVVSSVAIDSIKDVHSIVNPAVTGAVVLPDVAAGTLKSRVRLSTNGDTIFYSPSAKLTANSIYALNFDVRLKSEPISGNHAGVLQISWKTKAGVMISATNVMANVTTFRSFKVIGDSLVVTFTKAVDTAYNAPTQFKINGFVNNVTKTWSADLKTVKIKNLDTLSARTYSILQNDMTTNNTTYNNDITFDLTCSDGEEKTGLGGENLYVGKMAIKTEYKCALIATNTVENHSALTAIANTETAKDTFAIAGKPTLTFSRAIDTVKIKADAGSQYIKYFALNTFPVTAPLEFTLQFSSDAKTVTFNPVTTLMYGAEYNIAITSVPVIGIMETVTGSGAGSTILSTGNGHDFKTVPASDVIISALTTTIALDTPNGYTPMSYNGTVAEGHFMVRVWKTAWNALYADSVDGYQFRVRSFINGTWTSWYIIGANAGTGSAYDPFSAQVNGTDRYFASDVSVVGEASIYSALKVADGDGAVGSYQNGDRMLNDSTIVQIQSRAFVDNGGVKSYAQWSSAISYVDGIAPGDPIYGSTNVTVTPNFGVASIDRATNATIDSSNYITIVFPEDMTITTTPSITFYDGANTGSTAPAVAATSKWLDGRTYRFYIRLASGVNYLTAGPGEWYYKVSVNGMKDFSGVTLQSSGTSPAPAPGNNVLWANFGTTTAPVQGNLNAGVGNGGKPGFYQMP